MAKRTLTRKAVKKAAPAPVELPTFEFGDKTYQVTKSAIVPSLTGPKTLTPADIAVNTEAQKYLVEHGCSCVEEVVE